ncbi:MAG TPA: PAS domain S-box protein [Syntrophales bacterium]|nr:PAS domain S-box protein [Syntrophales bacterium]
MGKLPGSRLIFFRPDSDRPEVAEFRRTILNRILFVISLLGLPAAVIGAVQSWMQGRWVFSVLYLGLYGIFLAGTFASRRLSYRVRALILVSALFLVSFSILLRIGMSGVGMQLLLGVCFLSALLYGMRTGILVLLACIAAIIFVAVGMTTGFIPIHPEHMLTSRSAMAWITGLFIFTMLVAVMVIAPEMLRNRIEESLDVLEEQKKEAEEANLKLQQEIQVRKKTEEGLRESEELYRNLFDNHTAVKLLIDPETAGIVDANRAAVEYYGWPLERLRRMKMSEINTLSPEEVNAAMERAKTGRQFRFEFRHRRADGSIRDVEGFSSRIRVKGKDLLHSIIHDITARKEAENALRDSEERFRRLAENARDGIWTTDLDLRFTYVSPYIEEMLGYTAEEFLGMPPGGVLTPASLEKCLQIFAEERAAEEGGSGNPQRSRIIEVEHVHKNGGLVWGEIKVTFLRDQAGRAMGILGFTRDITERKRVEEEQERLKEELNRSRKLESVGTLAGGIAHDFNNLLMGIQGHASLMMLDLPESHPHRVRLQYIQEQVVSASSLAGQLLGFARGGRYEVKPTDMNDIVGKTADMFGRTKKEIIIHRSFRPDLWTAEVDRSQMEQVFMNLYVNAGHAMPGGGELRLGTDNVVLADGRALSLAPGRYVKISVSDTGIGMDDQTRERIFDPFFTTKGMGRGTGLGLATVYGIIKGHGGAIDVASRPGRGTTFEIHLPASNKAVDREVDPQASAAGGTETILLVDDETMILNVAREMLEVLGYRVLCAGSGQEAVAVYREKKDGIDMVILDMIMPGMSGGETFDRLREIDAQVPVLLSSGYSIDGAAREILDRGCNGFLQKPFQMERLARGVRSILDGNNSGRIG